MTILNTSGSLPSQKQKASGTNTTHKKKIKKGKEKGGGGGGGNAGAHQKHEQPMSNHVWEEGSYCPCKHHRADGRGNRQQTKGERPVSTQTQAEKKQYVKLKLPSVRCSLSIT